MAQKQYQRLTRPRARAQFAVVYRTRSALWLGGDHLLLVETNGFTENYKRFYFRDIQAITVQETHRGQVWNFIRGGILLLSTFVMFFTWPSGAPARWNGGEFAGEIALATVMVISGVFLLVGLVAGPTCKTYLRTAVQIEELASLCRVRQTRKVVDKIRPLMAAAQGEISGEEVSVRMQETMREQNPAESSKPNPPDAAPPVST
jgi:hypothetical protein